MKKTDLLAVYGTLESVGEAFAPVNNGTPLTRSAISQWSDEIPELREFQIRKIVPDIEGRIAAARKQLAAA
jgi:hypothetical protein